MANRKDTAENSDLQILQQDPLLDKLPEKVRQAHNKVRHYLEDAEALDTFIVLRKPGANAAPFVDVTARLAFDLWRSPFPVIWEPTVPSSTRTVLPMEAELTAARNCVPFPMAGKTFTNAHMAALDTAREIAESASRAIDDVGVIFRDNTSIEGVQKCFQRRLLKQEIITVDLHAGAGWKDYLERYLQLRPQYEISAIRAGMHLELAALGKCANSTAAAARVTKTNKKASALTKSLPPKVPSNPLVQKLLDGMKNPKNKTKTKHEIAMGITDDDENKAKSICAQARRYRRAMEAYKISEHSSEQS